MTFLKNLLYINITCTIKVNLLIFTYYHVLTNLTGNKTFINRVHTSFIHQFILF